MSQTQTIIQTRAKAEVHPSPTSASTQAQPQTVRQSPEPAPPAAPASTPSIPVEDWQRYAAFATEISPQLMPFSTHVEFFTPKSFLLIETMLLHKYRNKLRDENADIRLQQVFDCEILLTDAAYHIASTYYSVDDIMRTLEMANRVFLPSGWRGHCVYIDIRKMTSHLVALVWNALPTTVQQHPVYHSHCLPASYRIEKPQLKAFLSTIMQGRYREMEQGVDELYSTKYTKVDPNKKYVYDPYTGKRLSSIAYNWFVSRTCRCSELCLEECPISEELVKYAKFAEAECMAALGIVPPPPVQSIVKRVVVAPPKVVVAPAFSTAAIQGLMLFLSSAAVGTWLLVSYYNPFSSIDAL